MGLLLPLFLSFALDFSGETESRGLAGVSGDAGCGLGTVPLLRPDFGGPLPLGRGFALGEVSALSPTESLSEVLSFLPGSEEIGLGQIRGV